MLLAARAQARQRFEANRSLDPQGPEYTAALEEAEGVCTILRQNVVQGTSGGEGEKFSMFVTMDSISWAQADLSQNCEYTRRQKEETTIQSRGPGLARLGV